MLAYTWKVDADWKLRLTCVKKSQYLCGNQCAMYYEASISTTVTP